MQRIFPSTVYIPFRSTVSSDICGGFTLELRPYRTSEADDNFVALPWNDRAWVYQEQVLAKRLLIFGKTMLQMRCRRDGPMENGLLGEEQSTMEKGVSGNLWNIGRYSRKKLTYRRDRLGAVSGVARLLRKSALERGQPIEFLAGLWLDTSVTDHGRPGPSPSVQEPMALQLCWIAQEPAGTFHKLITSLTSHSTYCAPSWTWASRDGRLSWIHPYNVNGLFKILCWDLRPLRSDAMVAVQPGSSITLQGVMRPFSLTPPPCAYNGTGSEQDKAKFNKRGSPHRDFGQVKYFLDWTPDTGSTSEVSIRHYNISCEEPIHSQLKTFVIGRENYSDVYGLVLFPAVEDLEDEAFFHEPVQNHRVDVLEDEYPNRILISRQPQLVRVLRRRYYRVGVYQSLGQYQWVDDCPEVEVTII